MAWMRTAFRRTVPALLLAGLAASSRAEAQESFVDRTLAAQTRLTARLIDRLQAKGTENVIVSPAGVASAFALLDVGTSESYRAAARNVLGFDARHAAATDFEDLRDSIATIDKAADGAGSVFSFANAAVFDPRLNVRADILPRMRETRADVSVQSLADAATVQAINGWVASKTRGLIPTIVDDSIGGMRLIVLNALSFKDDWAVAFDKARTLPAPFHNAAGTVSDVPMMHARMATPFRSDGRFAAIDLRYKSDRFSLVLVTTRDGPANFAEFAGVLDWLSGNAFEPADVGLQMPRFTLRQSFDVLPALDAAGLAAARRAHDAFSPMAVDPVDISAVLQKIYLGINEQGTEAAAVTSVMVRAATVAPRLKSETLAIDRPFLFALRDRMTGLILLSGYLGRIPAEATQ